MKSIERPSLTSARVMRAYNVEPHKLEGTIKEAVESLARWRFEGSEGRKLHAVRESRIFRFEDDVTVSLSARGTGSEVVFESASRVGKGDLGQNPRNLRDLIEAVDRLLG
jgi:uncharacterized protein (DUF1499 family)